MKVLVWMGCGQACSSGADLLPAPVPVSCTCLLFSLVILSAFPVTCYLHLYLFPVPVCCSLPWKLGFPLCSLLPAPVLSPGILPSEIYISAPRRSHCKFLLRRSQLSFRKPGFPLYSLLPVTCTCLVAWPFALKSLAFTLCRLDRRF